MTTETETIETQYGTVEVETVTCDSCGQRIGKEEAHDFTIGDREGYACDHCVDDGPISFPPSVDFNVEPAKDIFLGVVMWPILSTMSIPSFIAGSDNKRANEYAVSSLGALLWTTLPLLLLLYFGVI